MALGSQEPPFVLLEQECLRDPHEKKVHSPVESKYWAPGAPCMLPMCLEALSKSTCGVVVQPHGAGASFQ